MLETFSLPTIADLKLICKSLAALDLIFVEEQYSLIRKFHYETNWRKGKEAFFYSDGYEQAMMIIFAKEDFMIMSPIIPSSQSLSLICLKLYKN